jgi:hypothetical protein
VEAFSYTSLDGRKIYVKGRKLTWTVDIENFSLDALTCQLALELNIGGRQWLSVWYFDKELGKDVRLLHDKQTSLMFEMYATEMTVPLSVVVVDVIGSTVSNGAEEFVPISVVAADDPLVMGTESCPNDVQHVPTTPTQPAAAPIAESVASEVGSTSQPNAAAAPIADQPQEPKNPPTDPFDNEEEYVGVDDEHLVGVSIPQHVVLASAVAPVEEASNASEDDMDFSDVKNLMQQEEEVTDIPLHVNVANDPYNADIKVGAMFPDMVTFRKAIRHHAIVADFEMAKVRTDSTRFIANCSHPDCPWRIHASKLRDQQVVMVFLSFWLFILFVFLFLLWLL